MEDFLIVVEVTAGLLAAAVVMSLAEAAFDWIWKKLGGENGGDKGEEE